MTGPDAGTRLAGVVGHPVAHSLSPAIHNAALRHAGMNAVYLAFDVDPEAFPAAVRGLAELGAVGINVTVPHKRLAFELGSTRSEAASRVGAANTLVFVDGAVHADNTDLAGIVRSLGDLGLAPEGLDVLVIGTGGAGMAAAWALAVRGAARVVVTNRTAGRAEELAARLRAGGFDAEAVSLEEVGDVVGRVDLIVQATTVGMGTRLSPLPLHTLAKAATGGCRGVLDLVYGPEETRLVREARAAGIPAIDGLPTLVHQAADAFRLFFSRAPDEEVMLQAALRAAGRVESRPAVEADELPPIV